MALDRTTEAYRAYLDAQCAKTQRVSIASLRHPRVHHLARRWWSVAPTQGHAVLSVGCRNLHELHVLTGFGCRVTGIDLVAQSSPMIAMDMHALGFREASFDAIFACHSLEHAYDVSTVLAEWRRVTRPGGVWILEVPVRFVPTTSDLQDFGFLGGLRQACCLTTELYACEFPGTPGRVQLIGRP